MQTCILLIGRNTELIDFLQHLFVLDATEVVTSCEIDSVKRILETKQPHLIIEELTMLGSDGLDLIRFVRGNSRNPIILLAYLSDVSRVNAAFELGIDGYLALPFKPNDLRSGVRTLLNRQRNVQPGKDASPPLLGGIQSYSRWLQAIGTRRRFELAFREGVLRLLAPLNSRRSIQ